MGCAFPNTSLDNSSRQQAHKRSYKKTQKIDCRKKSTQFIDQITQNIEVIFEPETNIENQQRSFLRTQDLIDQKNSFLMKFFKSHYLFQSLSQEQIQKIIEQMALGTVHTQKDDGYLFKKGQKGNSFFVIYKGEFAVEIQGQIEKTISQGDSFGQIALLYNANRTASIKVINKSTNLKEQTAKEDQSLAKGKNSSPFERYSNLLFVLKPGLFRKTLREINTKNYLQIKQLLGKIQVFTFLTTKQRASLSNIFVKNHFKKGDVIFKEGQQALSFFIIIEGKIQIQFERNSQGNTKIKQNVVLSARDSFGQSSFKEDGKRQGKAVVLEDAICFSLGRNQLKRCLGDSYVNILYFNIQKWALKQSKLFQDFDNCQIDRIAAEFKLKHAKAHQIIVEANVFPNKLVVCLQGKICNKGVGTLFCQEHFQNRQLELETSVHKNDAGVYSYAEFSNLDKVVSKIREIKEMRISSRPSLKILKDLKQNNHLCHISINNFEYLKKLGQGQFGMVYLVKDPTLGKTTYALKCIEKQAIVRQNMENSIISQKRILQMISFSHIVGFAKAFADSKYIYFVMEFIDGQQMFEVIRQIGVLNKQIGRFYFGSLLISIEYLHSHNIIYRDLKPENSVVDHKGKVHLIDMGTAKQLKNQTFYRTFTIIGTPHYLAPEVMQGRGYTFDADYWTLGVILYEFLCAKLPFGETLNDPYAIYAEAIRSQLKFPSFFNDQLAKNLIKKLLSKNPSQRSSGGGIKGIKTSNYFDGFSWKDLLTEKMQPPYIPKKFRTTYQQKYEQMQGVNFLKFLYKHNDRDKGKSFVPPMVLQWNQKFK